MPEQDEADLSAITANFIPAHFYTDPGLTAREAERLWPRVWMVACREEELPQLGDYVAFEVLHESILVVRTGDEAFSAYYNVCQHRARRLQDEPRGNVRQGFYCRFHGWKYRLDGSLQFAVGQEDWSEGVLAEQGALKQARVGRWGGWIWVCMDPQAPDLAEYLGAITEILAPLRFDQMRRHWHKTLVAPVNWKVVIGAFNEGYHAGATHDGGISYRPMRSPAVEHGDHSMYFGDWTGLTRVRDAEGCWQDVADLRESIHANCFHLYDKLRAMVLEPSMNAANRLLREVPAGLSDDMVLERFWTFQREETEKLGALWPDTLTPADVAAAGTGWHLFPNTIFLPTVDGVLWYRLRPGKDGTSCYFDMWSLGRYAPGEEPEVTHEVYEGFDAFTGQCPFLEEDFGNLLAVDKGMHSRGWEGALLNPVQELQMATFMRALHRYCGAGG